MDGLAPTVAASDNQKFWNGIVKLPEPGQQSFWDAGNQISGFLGESPDPRLIDVTDVPADLPWYERFFFYIGAGAQNQAVSNQMATQGIQQGAGWLWDALKGDFNKSPTTGQVITGGIISLIPFVDQACDVRDVVANCIILSDQEQRKHTENWVALGLTCIGFIPEIGSAVKTVAKTVYKDAKGLLELLKVMEHLEQSPFLRKIRIKVPWGRAPGDWLKRYDWIGAAKAAGSKAKAIFIRARTLAQKAHDYAVGSIRRQLERLIETFSVIVAHVEQAITDVANSIKEKLAKWLPSEKKEAGNYRAETGENNSHKQKSTDPTNEHSKISATSRVATKPNTAFFWSGKTNGVGGAEVAADIARENNGTTLETLIEERGIKMPEWNPNNPESVKAWEDISEEYAKGVSGEVRSVVGSSLRPGNIWENKELPALMKNPNVTKITTIDPVTHVENQVHP